ncbi:hypothetical protein C0Q70_04961 [Pomacea canaliculata]|uniref:Uncharacterized protein n=1 Tax=Pomacea canaliculata TaxID=400727 RepID=A0A2T7PJU0_POMCA|nr:hypothetical protein C0Q70_04961 [Pomacea canaliculata]
MKTRHSRDEDSISAEVFQSLPTVAHVPFVGDPRKRLASRMKMVWVESGDRASLADLYHW